MAKNQQTLAQQIAAIVAEEMTKALASVSAAVEARVPELLASAIGIPTGAAMLEQHINNVVASGAPAPGKRGRGRPKRAESPAASEPAAAPAAPAKVRQRPRLTGSEEAAAPVAAPAASSDEAPRRRGRPPGSKNKAKDVPVNGAAEYQALSAAGTPTAEA